MIIQAHTVPSTLQSSVLRRPWFVILVLAGAMERLSGLALGVAMERDWVVLVQVLHTFCRYCILAEGHTFLMFNSCPIPD